MNMRGILSKGRKVYGSDWIQGNVIENNHRWFIYDMGFNTEIIPETLCRCTGFDDKNNKKIFEDDVCMCPYIDAKVHFHGNKPERCHIEFYDGMFIARWDNDRVCKLSALLDELEVIGNIHDRK